MLGSSGSNCTMRRRFIPRQGTNGRRGASNVRVACSGDIDEVVRLMHDAAAWMSAKGTPAWDVARIDRTFAETFVLRSELLVASCSDGIVGCCTLSAEDPEFWPDALKGRPHICTSSRCDGHMRAGVSAPR